MNVIVSIIFFGVFAVSAIAQTIPISQARQQEYGTTVTRIAGRVTAAGVFRSNAFLQDGTAGINIFNAQFRAGVRIGDSVVVENGTLAEFNPSTGQPGTGLSQLTGNNLTFTVIPVERDTPEPRNVTIPNVGESVESQLVRLRRVRFLQTGNFQGETNYQVRDLFGNDIDVRIDGATEIASGLLPIPDGDIDLIGVVGQFRGAYQIQPRFATDLGLPPVVPDTVPSSRTFDLTSWNLEWFGWADSTRGPRDKQRQRESIARIMDTIAADIYALQEVVSADTLTSLADMLAGDYGTLFATDITSEQKLAYIYNRATVTPVTNGLAVNGGAQAWANGRFPYRLTFDVTVGGQTRRMVVFNIHGKATDSATAMEDYNRRKTDAETFHAYLRDFYADSLVYVVGDFNDGILRSVVDTTLRSPYMAFLDDSRWSCQTCPMAERGLGTYLYGSRGMIDNILVRNTIAPHVHRTFIENPQAFTVSYGSTVTDHLPVTTRVFIDAISNLEDAPSAPSHIRLSPNPASTSAMMEITRTTHGRLTVELVDVTGRVQRIVDEEGGPQVRVVVLPTADLVTGMWMVRVTEGLSVSTLPLMIVR